MIGVLLSGGVDSACLMGIARERGLDFCGIFVNWHQPSHWFEDFASESIAKHYGVMRHAMWMPSTELKKPMQTGVGATGPRFVRGRNMLFLSMAATIPGIDTVWFGACRDDWEDYADCTEDFVSKASAALSVYGISVEAPLIGMDKREIREACRDLEVPVHLAWSCYEPRDGQQCGSCNSCISNRTGYANRYGEKPPLLDM